MMMANGTEVFRLKEVLTRVIRKQTLPGIKFCIVKVIVRVVIKALSAAGSSMVPRTEDI